ncbi:12178_t:CDS:2 [Ambispora gerdemannii]|uniref:Phosphatidylinositol 4-kinase n=1 Tax=Ambispora gerdemannii TaxID=144530 RepID=A0A9N9GA24_9GLOM|nr:12178_t:CDS:2 [Ambispora gerdemannii]
MINHSNGQKKTGYVKIQQRDSFEEETIDFDSPPAQSLQTTKPYYRSNSDNINSYSRKKKRPLLFPFQESRILTEQESPRDNIYTHSTMEPLNENGEAIYSISAPERSATAERKRKNLDEYDFVSIFKPIASLKDWQPTLMPLTADHKPPMNTEQFLEIVESVKTAISSGYPPQRISQGSSGSYFCRDKEGRIVGVFKPKNEEPYGNLNPKWTKWIHRNLFPCFFGRSCLIPNLGYISEAGAFLLDQRLQLHIVPFTKVTHLSSPSFHYDYLDRHAAKSKKNPKPLPEKIGSFQVFLEGYKDANVFLRDHPWPENDSQSNLMRAMSQEIENEPERQQHSRLNALMCLSNNRLEGGDESEESYPLGRRFAWTQALQDQFREQFEKLIILDYLMRNTDRGLDNWMIKYCEKPENINVALSPPKPVNMMSMKKSENSDSENTPLNTPSCDIFDIISTSPSTFPEITDAKLDNNNDNINNGTNTPLQSKTNPASTNADNESLNSANKSPSSSSCSQKSFSTPYPHVHVAAIDNGLAFPFKHPDSWRSYPYGWLYLPTSLIGRPFTQKTRNHFLPLLSDPQWWKETVNELRVLFQMDADFDEGMFQKQVSVLKGQGCNIIEALTQLDQGPIDLYRKQNVVIVLDEETVDDDNDEIMPSSVDDYVSHNNAAGIPAVNNAIGGEPVSERFDIPPSPKIRRSMSEDSGSIQRPSAAVSAAGKSSLTAASSMSQKWAAKLKSKLNFDFDSKHGDGERRKKKIVRERLDTVKGAVPFFTCC